MIKNLNCPHCEHALSPHELGTLFARLGKKNKRFWGAKLTRKDADHIRKLKAPIREIAEKYNVSFHTIWRIKRGETYTGSNELKCPHCEHELQPHEVTGLFATLGGANTSPLKARKVAEGGRSVAKLTWKDADDIRKSKASAKELAKKYKVHSSTITRVRRNESWSTKK